MVIFMCVTSVGLSHDTAALLFWRILHFLFRIPFLKSTTLCRMASIIRIIYCGGFRHFFGHPLLSEPSKLKIRIRSEEIVEFLFPPMNNTPTEHLCDSKSLPHFICNIKKKTPMISRISPSLMFASRLWYFDRPSYGLRKALCKVLIPCISKTTSSEAAEFKEFVCLYSKSTILLFRGLHIQYYGGP